MMWIDGFRIPTYDPIIYTKCPLCGGAPNESRKMDARGLDRILGRPPVKCAHAAHEQGKVMKFFKRIQGRRVAVCGLTPMW